MRKTLPALLLFAALLCAPAGCAGQGDVLSPTPGPAGPFSDVSADAPYAQAVAWCRETGLMNGVSDTAFDPDGALTRATAAAVLYRAAGEPAAEGQGFTDTPADAWYYDAVVWAAGAGILRGYGDGAFGPDDPITQEELDLILRRYRGEDPEWTGDPALAEQVTRAQAAMAFMEYLNTGGTVSAPGTGGTDVKQIYVLFNGYTYTATLEDNPSAAAFVQFLRGQGGSVTVAAQDYGGFEKAGPLGRSITAGDEEMSADAGDLILYQGSIICLCYAPNAWSFTRLGRLDGDLGNLKADLGYDTVSITYFLG